MTAVPGVQCLSNECHCQVNGRLSGRDHPGTMRLGGAKVVRLSLSLCGQRASCERTPGQEGRVSLRKTRARSYSHSSTLSSAVFRIDLVPSQHPGTFVGPSWPILDGSRLSGTGITRPSSPGVMHHITRFGGRRAKKKKKKKSSGRKNILVNARLSTWRAFGKQHLYPGRIRNQNDEGIMFEPVLL